MNIKKLGHCCLLIRLPGIGAADGADNYAGGKTVTILTDPGAFSTAQNEIKGIDIVLITHEHGDHLHIESLKTVLANNPAAQVYTNSGVGAKLAVEGIAYHPLEGKDMKEFAGNDAFSGLTLQAYDSKHEEIFEDFGQVQNTGYMISVAGASLDAHASEQNGGIRTLFYPGDSYCNPQTSVDVLAMPVGGPWCKIPDAIRYAIEVKPKKAFPVHDSTLQPDRIGSCHSAPAKYLPLHGIEFIPMVEGDEKEF